VFAAALAVLHHVFSRFHFSEVTDQLRRIPAQDVQWAVGLTASSYLALAGFDGLGAHYIGRPLSPARILLISFVSHAVSHSAGFATLTGGAVRLRMYSAAGLSPGEVAAVVAFCGLTFGLGASGLAALALLVEPSLLSNVLTLPSAALRGLGGVLAVAVTAYVAWSATARRPIRLFRRDYPVPPPHLALLQIMVAATDLALASAALYVLLPAATRPDYPAFLGAYVVANLLGLLAHVPGGIGVFDATILVLTPGAPPSAVLGALLLFRLFYNLLPLSLAALLLAVFEIIERVPRVGARIGGLFDDLGPPLLAVTVFAAGGLVVIDQSFPSDRIGPPAAVIIAIAEAVTGCLLMILARGINRRDRWSRLASIGGMLVLTILVFVEDRVAPRVMAGALLTVVLALSEKLSDPPLRVRWPSLTAPWIGAIAAVMAGAVWLTEWRSNDLSPAAAMQVWIADACAIAVFVVVIVVDWMITRRHQARPKRKGAAKTGD
jgi:phosphatidylglycerol lysyltransferase